MASNILTKFCSNSILSERVTNLNKQHADLVHCPLCNNILWKAVTCTLCDNSFCAQCIEIWLLNQQEQINENDYLTIIRCPFNCSPYIPRNCSPLLNIILSKLTIECRNKVYGCSEILFYEQLEQHEEELCPYQILQCPGCKQHMFKTIFDSDKHLSKCLYVKLECIKCQTIFIRKDKHNQFDCLEKQICLLKQKMIKFEQKSYEIFHIHRKRIDITNEKLTIIEDIWQTDSESNDDYANNDLQIDKNISLIQLMGTWKIMAGIGLILFLIFKFFFVK